MLKKKSIYTIALFCTGFAISAATGLSALTTKKTFTVTDFGTTGDGTKLDTAAIQKAVDQCAENGGGKVIVPPGQYLVGTIILRNNVHFHLENGAKIIGSTSLKDYKVLTPKFKSYTSNNYVNRSIIYAEGLKNITISGPGVIDGQGRHKNFSRARPVNKRPFIARFVTCTNVIIRDVSMLESACWTCHLLGCRNVAVKKLKIRNSVRANRDGIDIDSCSSVTIRDCTIDSQDDAIVLKSTSHIPCRDISIENCSVSSHAAGIKMGTESNAGYENISIRRCHIHDVPSLSGLALMVVDGGTMRNISISEIEMERVNTPIFIRLGNRARPVLKNEKKPAPGSVSQISLSNISVKDAGYPCTITGLNNHPVTDISFNGLSFSFTGRYKGKPLAFNRVPLKEKPYPTGTLYGSDLPASAFYIRNVKNMSMNNIKVEIAGSDSRTPFVIDRSSDITINACMVKQNSPAKTMLYVRNASDISLANPISNTPLLITQEKNNTSGIVLTPDKQSSRRTCPALLDQTH